MDIERIALDMTICDYKTKSGWPLFAINWNNVTILTHKEAEERYNKKLRKNTTLCTYLPDINDKLHVVSEYDAIKRVIMDYIKTNKNKWTER